MARADEAPHDAQRDQAGNGIAGGDVHLLDVFYDEIDEAVLRRHRWGGTIRLRRRNGDVTLTTMGGNYVRIGALLHDRGVRVTGDQVPAADPH